MYVTVWNLHFPLQRLYFTIQLILYNVIVYFCFKSVSPDAEKYLQTASSSGNSPVIVGGTLGACVIVIIGVVFALFVIR